MLYINIEHLIEGLDVTELIHLRDLITKSLQAKGRHIKIRDLKSSTSTRLYNILEDLEIKNLVELQKMDRNQFSKIRGVGTSLLKETDLLMKTHGLVFKNEQLKLTYEIPWLL